MQGLQGHIALRTRNGAGADGRAARRGGIAKLVEVLQLAAGVGHHIDIIGVEQPVAALAALRAGVDADAGHIEVMARGFHQAAVAGSHPAARRHAAMHARRSVAPDDHLAAVARDECIGPDAGVAVDCHLARIGNCGIFSLVVAAQQDRAAPGGAAGVHAGVAQHANLLAQYRHLATLAGRVGGGGDAARFQHGLAGCFQHNLAVLADHRAAGVEHAALVQQRAGHADAPALGNDLPHIDGPVGRRRQHHAQIGVGGIGQLHAVAGGQQHVAIGRRDDAAVFHVRRDQEDLPAAAGIDRSLVDHGTGRVARIEIHLAGQEILVRQGQARRHQAGHVHARVAAEQHAVRIDQEHLAVRLQRAEDLAGVLPRNAVQYAAVGILLDKARDLARIDREALPVDDGIGRIGNRKQIALLVERGLAMHHLRQRRVGVGRAEAGGNHQRERGTAQRRTGWVRSGQGAEMGVFLHDVVILGTAA